MNARKVCPTILYATDLTEHSQEALEVAGIQARARGGKLVVIHVVPRMVPMAISEGMHELYKGEHFEADLQQYRAEMAQRLEQLPIPDSDIPVERRIAEGDVAEEILKVADAQQCSLIVMGARTRAEPMLPLLGSAASEVLEKAQCPVLIVKTPQ